VEEMAAGRWWVLVAERWKPEARGLAAAGALSVRAGDRIRGIWFSRGAWLGAGSTELLAMLP